MINRIKTDREVIQEAARNLAAAWTEAEFETACRDMGEALRYGRSVQWWSQIEVEAA